MSRDDQRARLEARRLAARRHARELREARHRGELVEMVRRHREFEQRERRIRGDALSRYSAETTTRFSLNGGEYVVPVAFRKGSSYKLTASDVGAKRVDSTPRERAVNLLKAFVAAMPSWDSTEKWDTALDFMRQAIADAVANGDEAMDRFWRNAHEVTLQRKEVFQKQAEQKFEEQRQAKLRQLKIIEDQLAHDAYIMELREAKTPEQEAYVKAKHEGKRYQDQLLDPEDETTPVAALKDEDWSFFARIGYERPKLQMPIAVAQKKALKPEWLKLPEIMNLRTGTRTQRPFQIAFYLCIFAAMLWLLAAGLNLSGVTGGSSLQQREHRVEKQTEQLTKQNQKKSEDLAKNGDSGPQGSLGQPGSDGHGGIQSTEIKDNRLILIYKDHTRVDAGVIQR